MATPQELPPKPQPPEPGDCCGSGCARCVLDVYDEQLAAWKAAVAALQQAATDASTPGTAAGVRGDDADESG